ncbi:unnamed protein product [Symbiodinium pilosum]|uniref:MD-2-related lipid-recognition domain-containing protein n=1 Tax=Symbiodinium pilosum TaxID=2952 RepID=A0A812SC62_SYMPI|nr:unnamed protein product [Symbiodinium pilosum]
MPGAFGLILWVSALAAHASAHEAVKLSWQDCGLLADEKGIELLDYTHEPDPIVLGEPYVITRRFRSLLDRPIQNLTETFQSYNRTAPATWTPTFAGGPFSRCGREQYQTRCPLQPKEEFACHEHHPATHVTGAGTHRAVEHYFADGTFVGCAVVVYQYTAPDPILTLL